MCKKIRKVLLFLAVFLLIFRIKLFAYYEDDYLKKFKELILNNNIEGIRKILESDNFILIRKDYNGYSPVIWAIMYNKIDVLRIMYNYFIPLDLKDDNNLNPLHWACKLNNFDALKLLLNFYDVNSKDNFGNTPLHYACINQNLIITNYLLSKGASPYIANISSLSPIDLAKNNKKLLQLFYKYYKDKIKNSQNIQLIQLIVSNLRQQRYSNTFEDYYEVSIERIDVEEIKNESIYVNLALYFKDKNKNEFKETIPLNLKIEIIIAKEQMLWDNLDLKDFSYDPILNYYAINNEGLSFYTFFLDNWYKINLNIVNFKVNNDDKKSNKLSEIKKDILIKLGKSII